jgi:hypothetical protein
LRAARQPLALILFELLSGDLTDQRRRDRLGVDRPREEVALAQRAAAAHELGVLAAALDPLGDRLQTEAAQIMPRRGWRQRTSASTPAKRPLRRWTIGWYCSVSSPRSSARRRARRV